MERSSKWPISVTTSPGGASYALPHAVRTLGAGVAIGAVSAGVVWLLASRFRLLPAKFARLGILGAALAAYTAAELVAHEAGVLAAAVAGIAIGSLDIPHKQQVEEFKGDIASIAISVALSSPLVRRVFRPLIEPKPEWLFTHRDQRAARRAGPSRVDPTGSRRS